MQRYILLSIVLFLIGSTITAQDNLTQDIPFLQKKARLYQRWLNSKKLSPLLQVDSIHLAKNGNELELFLKLNEPDPDRAAGTWRSLQRSFQPSPAAKTLEASLFNTFVRFTEVDPLYVNVQVYIPKDNTPNAPYLGCFYVWAWEENSQPMVKERIDNCMSQKISIEVPTSKFSTAAPQANTQVYHKAAAADIFEAVQHFAKQKYEVKKKDCDDRTPKVLPPDKQNDYELEFNVEDLCREVLIDEKQSLWCDFVELWWGPCNDMRRERLDFNINLHRGNESYILNIEITGKFGSGTYRPRTGWMDMDPDFEEAFLKPYAKNFQRELKAYLLAIKP